MPWLLAAKKQGVKFIIVDPRKTMTVDKPADMHLRVRPASDGTLALAIINVMIRENLYDDVFVEKWVYGFEELKRYAKNFTPEEAERLTWVPRCPKPSCRTFTHGFNGLHRRARRSLKLASIRRPSENLEFAVAIDYFYRPWIHDYVDIILPAATCVERRVPFAFFGRKIYGRKVVKPLGECKEDWQNAYSM